MTEDQLVEFGTNAGHLINDNEAFIQAVATVREAIIDDWANTKPAEAEKRESLYKQLDGLSDIVTELASMYAIKQEIAHRRNIEEINRGNPNAY